MTFEPEQYMNHEIYKLQMQWEKTGNKLGWGPKSGQQYKQR